MRSSMPRTQPYNPTGVNPGIKRIAPSISPSIIPCPNNYTLGIQQQVGRLAVVEIRYVGNHSYDQFQNLNGNAFINATPPTSTVTAAQGYKTLAQGFPNLFPSSHLLHHCRRRRSWHAELQPDDPVSSRQHRLQQLQRTPNSVEDPELPRYHSRSGLYLQPHASITLTRSSIQRQAVEPSQPRKARSTPTMPSEPSPETPTPTFSASATV